MFLAMALMAGISAQAQTKVNLSGEILGMEDSCKVSLVDAEGYQPKAIASTKIGRAHV